MASSPRSGGRFWLTFGEVVGVVAVVIAGLSYWDAHRERSVSDRAAAARARAEAAFILVGHADAAGRRLVLEALKPSQAIQSQHYVFPQAVRASPVDVAAARPEIEVGWLVGGLDRALDAAQVKGSGHGLLPVAITSTYIEDGDTRTDQSVYDIGYSWRPRFLLGREVRLNGVAVVRRAIEGDAAPLVEARWAKQTAGLR